MEYEKQEMDCRVAYFEPTNNVVEVRFGNFFDGYSIIVTKNFGSFVCSIPIS